MKIIVCTGDSHTVGQGANSIKTATIPKNPNAIYNTAGKGISRGGNLEVPSYVNLLRKYITEHSNSECDLTSGETLGEQTGWDMENGAVKLQGELELPSGWELHLVCFAEQVQPAKVAVYLDGKCSEIVQLHTPIPRYNDWSFRNVPIFCSKAAQVRLVPLEGDVIISHIQHDRGEFAVVNSGVGSCTSQRYLDECFDYCVSDFKPDYIIAEAHTINDWLKYPQPQMHAERLCMLLDAMAGLNAKLMLVTVAPVAGKQQSAKFGMEYADFTAQTKALASERNVIFADAHAAFCKVLAQIPAEEQFDAMYVDNWHVNGRGHRIYADAIIEKLDQLLGQ